MLNYWWVTRPKRRLDSIPEVLAAFAEISLNQEWAGQTNSHIAYEDALEKAGLKRVGQRRDQGGSGGRTYGAWLESLGLIFKQDSTGNIKLTLAGEAILSGASPVSILTNQVLKYQFPSAFSVSRGVSVNGRFHIRPFRFLLRLMLDARVEYLTQSEIARIIATEAEDESEKCYEHIVDRIAQYRSYGDSCLDPDFFLKHGPSRGEVNPDHPYSHLEDMANTMENWIEYTQLARRDDEGKLRILDEKRQQVQEIIDQQTPMLDRPHEHELFQRRYGLDPMHRKDTRNLEQTKTITARILAENKIRQAYIGLSLKKPITMITPELISEISEMTGAQEKIVGPILDKLYPHGSIGAFMAAYFEMAFKGTEEAVDFEKATTSLFSSVFGYTAIHLGQTGSKSAPDILLISDSDGYQSIIDNKAYSKYSITGDHHNRMVHNYIERIGNYSSCTYPIGYFSYIAGGFGNRIDRQIKDEATECGVNGSAITVANFIRMIENQNSGRTSYSHGRLREIFGINRVITINDF